MPIHEERFPLSMYAISLDTLKEICFELGVQFNNITTEERKHLLEVAKNTTETTIKIKSRRGSFLFPATYNNYESQIDASCARSLIKCNQEWYILHQVKHRTKELRSTYKSSVSKGAIGRFKFVESLQHPGKFFGIKVNSIDRKIGRMRNIRDENRIERMVGLNISLDTDREHHKGDTKSKNYKIIPILGVELYTFLEKNRRYIGPNGEHCLAQENSIGNVRWTLATRFNIMIQTCLEVQHCHLLGVIHKDIKPENLIVNPKTGILRLIDFGMVKALAENDIAEKKAKSEGTIDYISPEIWGLLSTSSKTDVWSMGKMFVELINPMAVYIVSSKEYKKRKRIGFDANSFHSMLDTIHNFPDKERNLFRQLILKMTEKEPKNRFSIEEAINYFMTNFNTIALDTIQAIISNETLIHKHLQPIILDDFPAYNHILSDIMSRKCGESLNHLHYLRLCNHYMRMLAHHQSFLYPGDVKSIFEHLATLSNTSDINIKQSYREVAYYWQHIDNRIQVLKTSSDTDYRNPLLLHYHYLKKNPNPKREIILQLFHSIEALSVSQCNKREKRDLLLTLYQAAKDEAGVFFSDSKSMNIMHNKITDYISEEELNKLKKSAPEKNNIMFNIFLEALENLFNMELPAESYLDILEASAQNEQMYLAKVLKRIEWPSLKNEEVSELPEVPQYDPKTSIS